MLFRICLLETGRASMASRDLPQASRNRMPNGFAFRKPRVNTGFACRPNWMFTPLFHRFRRHAGSRLVVLIGLLLAVAALEAGGLA